MLLGSGPTGIRFSEQVFSKNRMKISSYAIATLVVVAAALVTEPVFARGGRGGGRSGHGGSARTHSGGHHHHHGHTAVFVGAGAVGFAPWWGYPAYGVSGAYPAYGVVGAYPAAPLQYIEKGDGSAPAEVEWFYCRSLNAYFPYVAECPGGWERVLPEGAG